MSRHFWIVLSIGVILAIVGVEYHKAHLPRNSQAINMDKAREHLPIIQKRLDEDARFKKVQLYVYTGLDGAIGVSGDVDTEEVFQDLKCIVEATDPPRPVYWSVGRLIGDRWER
jgi:hypothetical protein